MGDVEISTSKEKDIEMKDDRAERKMEDKIETVEHTSETVDDTPQEKTGEATDIKDDVQEKTGEKTEIKDNTAQEKTGEITDNKDKNIPQATEDTSQPRKPTVPAILDEIVEQRVEKTDLVNQALEGKFQIKDYSDYPEMALEDFAAFTQDPAMLKFATYEDDLMNEVEEPPPPITMRIPHTIPEAALRVYEPSTQARELRGGEEGRSIRAEDFGWDALVPQPLTYWCVVAIVENFAENPLLHQLPPGDRDHVLEKLPVDLPLELSVPLVPDGIYWKRCCDERWETGNYVSNYGKSWKRMYLERHLEQYLEEMPVEDYRMDKTSELAKLLSPHVVRLRIRQLQLTRPPAELEAAAAAEMEEEEAASVELQDIINIARAPLPPERLSRGSSMGGRGRGGRGGARGGGRGGGKGGGKDGKGKGKGKASPPPLEPMPPPPPPRPPTPPTPPDEEEQSPEEPFDWTDKCAPHDELPLNHINLEPVLDALKFLKEFSLTFGVLNCGINFRWDLFKFSKMDIQNIGFGLQEAKSLHIFRLTRSLLDDSLGPELVRSLAGVPQLRVLDLSHCRLGDETACALGHLLRRSETLEHLDLTNNCIGERGAQGLAFALQSPPCALLRTLSLRLNRVGDGGAAALAAALQRGRAPQELSLAACGVGAEGALHLGRALRRNRTLRSLDLSNNPLGEDGGEYLEHAMAENSILTELDLRMTCVPTFREYAIMSYIRDNTAKYRRLYTEMKEMLCRESEERMDRFFLARAIAEELAEVERQQEEERRLQDEVKEEVRRPMSFFL